MGDKNKKIALTKEILATTLPSELQKYFEIQAKIVNNQFKYILNPSVDNAFELYPIQDKFKMKFSTPKEKEEFIKNGGINALIRQATITRKPVEIPHIEEVKEYIGEYENPFSDFNYTKSNKIKLYVLPHELPKGEKYKIKIDDGKENKKVFSIKNLGNKNYSNKDYESFKNYKSLLRKVIYIEKTFKIDIIYNLDYFYKNKTKIDFIYYDSKNRSCKLKTSIKASLFINSIVVISIKYFYFIMSFFRRKHFPYIINFF